MDRGAPFVSTRRLAVTVALAAIGAACALGTAGATGPTRRWLVASSAMEPNLHCARPGVGCLADAADVLLARPLQPGEPPRGAIVVFRAPLLAARRCGAAGTFIKRVVAIGGDRWSERNGFVYVNGHRLSETYVQPSRRDTRTVPALRVPSGRYFLMGDNRVISCDSREWGTAARSAISGRGVAIERGGVLYPLR